MPRQRKLKTPSKSKTGEIPEDEQWRIIENSGVLKNIPRDTPPSGLLNGRVEEANDELPETPFCNEIFNAILLIIPFSSLHITMDILAHRQYSQLMTSWNIVENALWSIPLLSLFIFYTTRHKAERRTQALLLFLSVICGSRLIYVVNWSSWKTVMKQCPPLGTMWIYTIVQLDLLPAVIGLGLVAGFVKWKDLKIVFN